MDPWCLLPLIPAGCLQASQRLLTVMLPSVSIPSCGSNPLPVRCNLGHPSLEWCKGKLIISKLKEEAQAYRTVIRMLQLWRPSSHPQAAGRRAAAARPRSARAAASSAGVGRTCRLPDGREVHCVSSEDVRLLYNEIYRERLYLRRGVDLRPGSVVVDAGANIGERSAKVTPAGDRLHNISAMQYMQGSSALLLLSWRGQR